MNLKHVAAALVSIAWLWYFFGGPAFLPALAAPVLGALVLSVWKKMKAFELFEPLIYAFSVALALTTLLSFLYRLSFDLVFLGIVSSFPIFTVIPVFVLATLFFAAYGWLALHELEKIGAKDISASAFYIALLAAIAAGYLVFWAWNQSVNYAFEMQMMNQ